MNYAYCGTYSTPGELYKEDDEWLQRVDRKMLIPTLAVFDRARESHGHPLLITSGRRSQRKQRELGKQGYRTAKYSPHCEGAAVDVLVPKDMRDVDLAALFRDAAQALGLDPPRIGYLRYRGDSGSSTFVHMDMAFSLPKAIIEIYPEYVQQAWLHAGLIW